MSFEELFVKKIKLFSEFAIHKQQTPSWSFTENVTVYVTDKKEQDTITLERRNEKMFSISWTMKFLILGSATIKSD